MDNATTPFSDSTGMRTSALQFSGQGARASKGLGSSAESTGALKSLLHCLTQLHTQEREKERESARARASFSLSIYAREDGIQVGDSCQPCECDSCQLGIYLVGTACVEGAGGFELHPHTQQVAVWEMAQVGDDDIGAQDLPGAL